MGVVGGVIIGVDRGVDGVCVGLIDDVAAVATGLGGVSAIGYFCVGIAAGVV